MADTEWDWIDEVLLGVEPGQTAGGFVSFHLGETEGAADESESHTAPAGVDCGDAPAERMARAADRMAEAVDRLVALHGGRSTWEDDDDEESESSGRTDGPTGDSRWYSKARQFKAARRKSGSTSRR